jgi:glycerol-3-phosphate dehydrogenase
VTEASSEDLGTLDVIVIGAGINGAGIARDAAMRGLSVLLLDKGDVASGTTSYSTRLIHGGLRYLEHGEVGLVRESLRERERLFKIAPHLVQPLPLLIPSYQGNRRGPLLIRAGMIAYDALSPGKSLPHHQALNREAARKRVPGLARNGLRGAMLYYDGQVEFAERLALENALDARDHGALLRTYHQVDQILNRGGKVSGVAGHDLLTGAPFRATAAIVVNVAGPWVDSVLAETEMTGSRRMIGGTKGSHIVVDPFPGNPAVGVYAESHFNGRPFFIIPWNEAFLIGTTDTRYDGCLGWMTADDREIDWLLAEANRLIPDAGLTRADIRYSYAGVRPLPASPGAEEGSVSRRHMIVDHARHGGPRGLLSVVGGKLTTYRELAEQVVDVALRIGKRPSVRSRTAEIPLPGGRTPQPWLEFKRAFMREAEMPTRSTEHLLRVYGSRAIEVLAMATTPELRAVIDPESGAIAAEVPWAFRQEGARTLADLLARRSMIGLGSNAGVGADVSAARVARETLGWDEARHNSEIDAYRHWIRRYRPRALAGASNADA